MQEDHNLLGNFDPNVGLIQVGKQISHLYNPDHKNFGPRMGFAWDIGGNGRTVLRGGGGLTYETVNWQSFIAFNNAFGPGSVPTGAPIDASNNTSGGTITTGNTTLKYFLSPTPVSWDPSAGPLYGAPTINCFNSPCPIMTVARNLTTPYVWTWTLNLQHALTSNMSVEVAYVGNHGTSLTGIRDINQPPVGSGWPAANIAACNLPANLVNGQYDTANNSVCQVAPEVGPFAGTGTSVMALDCHRTPTTSAVSTPTATSIFVIDSHCHLLTLCPDVRVTPKRWKAGRSTRLRPWKVHNIGGRLT